jgi:hypothetical protein
MPHGRLKERVVRQLFVGLLLSTVIATLACGGGGTPASSSEPLSGNWQIILTRHAVPTQPLTFTGFLTQSGDSVSGNLILGSGFIGSGCSGVGPVTGTVTGQNVSLNINQFGEDVSLVGTMPAGNAAPMNGAFSWLAGGCNAFPGTGTYSAFQVTPISGSFHGTFTSTLPPPNNGTVNVVGTLTQGPNTGGSTANLTGSISVVGTPHFCSYLSTATVTGLISGTSVSLNLFGPDGSLIAQIGQIGQIGNPQVTTEVTVTADATALSGPYTFPAISASCIGDQGTFQVTFP